MKTDIEGQELPEDAGQDQEQELIDRRNFLRGLGKWSLAVIGCVTLGSVTTGGQTAWVNRRGYGGGGGWVNGGGGGAWANRAVGGGAWVNGRGGGGGAWVNRRGY